MKRRITIDYHWTCDDNDSGEVVKKHEEVLEESAMDRIAAMVRRGYLMGELHDDVIVDDEDGDDGVSYSGWWGYKIEERKD